MCNFFPRGTLAATDSFDVFNGYQQDVPISLFVVDNRTAVCGDVVIAPQRSRDRRRLVLSHPTPTQTNPGGTS